MRRPDPKFSLPVRLSHALAAVLFIALALTGLRLAWYTEQDWLSPGFMQVVDAIAPAGGVYRLHALLGTLFAAIGVFYTTYMLISTEGRRLTNLFHRHEYSFTRKVVYFFTFLIGLTALVSGFSIYAGIYLGGPGYLLNSFLHHWSFRLLVLFMVLHILETVVSRRSGVNLIFFERKHIGFVQWPAIFVSAAVAVVGGVAFWNVMNQPRTLTCLAQNQAIRVDGRETRSEWGGADSIVVKTHGGSNFEYSAVPVTIKSLRTAYRVYFLLRWEDPTRSRNRYLEKTDSGWVPVRSDYVDKFGEDIHFEDQVSLYFSRTHDCLSTCHVGGAPNRAGKHDPGNDTADVWVWMAVSTDPVAEADDRYWLGTPDDTSDSRRFDNKAAGGYQLNLDSVLLYPYFAPTHRGLLDALVYGSGTYVPYDPSRDKYRIGDRIPAMLVAPTTGDRGDVKARGRWVQGVWTVEFSRRRSTGTRADVPLADTVHLGVAVFDNAEKKHAYHLRPIRLIVE